jgi:hypothetical protein
MSLAILRFLIAINAEIHQFLTFGGTRLLQQPFSDTLGALCVLVVKFVADRDELAHDEMGLEGQRGVADGDSRHTELLRPSFLFFVLGQQLERHHSGRDAAARRRPFDLRRLDLGEGRRDRLAAVSVEKSARDRSMGERPRHVGRGVALRTRKYRT